MVSSYPILALAIGCMAVESFSVAVITVGQERALAHPVVAASYVLARSTLLRDGHSVHHFIWLSPEVGHGRPAPISAEYSVAWRSALELYQPTLLIHSNATMQCKPECKLRCLPPTAAVGHDTPLNWLRQFFAVYQAYSAARDYGRANKIEYSWYIKRRPDLLHLQPLPSLALLSRDAAYVPHGVMTRAAADQLNNDHVVICPAGDLCERALAVYARTYGRCDASFRMRWPWQTLISGAYAPKSLRLLQHAYTIVRQTSEHGRPVGPECLRLTCSPSPYSTGCVAPHLVSFHPECERLAAGWSQQH